MKVVVYLELEVHVLPTRSPGAPLSRQAGFAMLPLQGNVVIFETLVN